MGSDSVMAPTRHPFFRPRRQDDTASRLNGGRGQSHTRYRHATRTAMKLAFCPACGAAEKPVLVMTPYYACPDCETVTPREKLEFKRKNLYALAGTGGGPQDIALGANLGGATLYDATQSTVFVQTTNVPVKAGRTYVVSYASQAAGDKNSPPSVLFDSLGAAIAMTKIHDAGTNLAQYGGQWYVVAPATKSVTIIVNCTSTSPISAQMFVHEVVGTNVVLDKTAISTGTSTTPDSGFTGARTSGREVCIAAASYQLRVSLAGVTWGATPGFLTTAGDGSDTGVSDSTLEYSELLIPNSSASIKANGTIGVSREWIMMLSTFKNA